MRFAIELDILNRFRCNKPAASEERHGINVTSPLLGVFGMEHQRGGMARMVSEIKG